MGKDNRGITMVEVMVAFTILAVVMLVFYNCIEFSGNMMAQTGDIDRDNNAFRIATEQEFSAGGAYDLGRPNSAEYTFTVKNADGHDIGSVTEDVYYADIEFKLDDHGKYEKTDSPDPNGRTLRVFSTGKLMPVNVGMY